MSIYTEAHCTRGVCAHQKGSLAGCLYLFLKKNKYKKTFETMFNYFTIPEIDIAFTIATTKLWSIQKFKISGSISRVCECIWVCLSVGVCLWVWVCILCSICSSVGRFFIKLKVFLLPKEGKTMSAVFNYSDRSNVFFTCYYISHSFPVHPVR